MHIYIYVLNNLDAYYLDAIKIQHYIILPLKRNNGQSPFSLSTWAILRYIPNFQTHVTMLQSRAPGYKPRRIT